MSCKGTGQLDVLLSRLNHTHLHIRATVGDTGCHHVVHVDLTNDLAAVAAAIARVHPQDIALAERHRDRDDVLHIDVGAVGDTEVAIKFNELPLVRNSSACVAA